MRVVSLPLRPVYLLGRNPRYLLGQKTEYGPKAGLDAVEKKKKKFLFGIPFPSPRLVTASPELPRCLTVLVKCNWYISIILFVRR